MSTTTATEKKPLLTIQKNLFDEEYVTPVQALSWKQPFASLMLHGKIETRRWRTNHRGPVLICTTAKPFSEGELLIMTDEELRASINDTLKWDESRDLFGYAIAIGRLVDCRPMKQSDEKMCFVKFKPSLWVHVYSDVKRIQPFLFKGGQKWRSVVDQQILSQIKFLEDGE